jgi:ferredoxin-NADP reductase
MLKTQFSLISKHLITHDVYELIYSCPDMVGEVPKPGQYVMFQLAPGLNRAYSMAGFTADTFTLVIKRIADGRGSPLICDAEIGSISTGMIPLGHFILQDTPSAKCFIGTGTGFAPLYCQMLESARSAYIPGRVAFIF